MAEKSPRPSGVDSVGAAQPHECSVESAVKCASEYVSAESKHFHDVVGTKILVPTVSAMEQVSERVNLATLARIEQFFVDNVTAMSIGAFFGAALTAGLGVGMVTASSMIHRLPMLYQYACQRYQLARMRREGHQKIANDTTHSKSDSQSSIITMLQVGVAKGDERTGEERIRVLLQSELERSSFSINDIRKVTVYLTIAHPLPVREWLAKFLSDTANDVITIVYVQRLESESLAIQLDVMCSRV